MKRQLLLCILTISTSLTLKSPASANDTESPAQIAPKPLNSVLYIDGLNKAANLPAGLSALINLVDAYKTYNIKGVITVVFDDDATTIVLSNDAYNKLTKTNTGNPYLKTIESLLAQNVVVRVCGNDLESKSLNIKDLASGVEATPRGILLVAQIQQNGGFCLPTPSEGKDKKE